MPKHELKKLYDSLLAASVHAVLKAAGFSRRGYTWSRPAPDDMYQVFYIDNWKYNSPAQISFRLHLGYFLDDWARKYYYDRPRKPEEVSSILRLFVNDLEGGRNNWFHLMRYSDVEKLTGTLRTVITELVLPEFEAVSDVRALTEKLKQNYNIYNGVFHSPVHLSVPYLLSRQGDPRSARKFLRYGLAADPDRKDALFKSAARLGLDTTDLTPAWPPPLLVMKAWLGRARTKLRKLRYKFHARPKRRLLHDEFHALVIDTMDKRLTPLGFGRGKKDFTYSKQVENIQQIVTITVLGGFPASGDREFSFRIEPAIFDAEFFQHYWPESKSPEEIWSHHCFLALHNSRPDDFLTAETNHAAFLKDLNDYLDREVIALFMKLTSRAAVAAYVSKKKTVHHGNTEHLGLPLYLAIAGNMAAARKAFVETARTCNAEQRAMLRRHASLFDLNVKI